MILLTTPYRLKAGLRTTEGAVLEGGEEGVMLRQRLALRRLQLLHRPHPTGECSESRLQPETRRWEEVFASCD